MPLKQNGPPNAGAAYQRLCVDSEHVLVIIAISTTSSFLVVAYIVHHRTSTQVPLSVVPPSECHAKSVRHPTDFGLFPIEA
eukprot:10452410-Karenia_brevis.AAC.1